MIESFLKALRKEKPEAEGFDVFSRLLLDSTLTRSIAGLEGPALAAFAHQAFQHTLKKPHKRHAINFATTGPFTADGGPLTLVGILNDDMPFVVESVIAELHAQGLIPRLVFHPVLKVKRYGSGRLQAVVGRGDSHWDSGDQESYIAVLTDPIDADRQHWLAEGLDLVLDDVRSAAADGAAMRSRIAQAAAAYDGLQLGLAPPPGAPAPLELREAADLLRWLSTGNFTLLGARDYEVVGVDGNADLWPVTTGALGISRLEAAAAAAGRPTQPDVRMTPAISELYAGPSPLVFYKGSSPSRVRRRVPLDCIGVKRYAPGGKLIGELRLAGLFTPASYLQSVASVPVVRQKVQQVLSEAKFPPDSHDGRTLVDILENFPRDELLQITPRLLFAWSMRLLDLSIRPRIAVLSREDELGGYCSVLVFVPRDHYSSLVRERMGAFLEGQLGGKVTASYPYISGGLLVRVHFIVAGAKARFGDEALENGVAELVKTWDERLKEALAGAAQRTRRPDVAAAFEGAFSAAYQERFGASRAIEDIVRIERLGPQIPVAIDFYRASQGPENRIRAAIYRFDEPIALSERVPVLENMGFKVIDERSYRIRPLIDGARREVVLHDMELETADGRPLDLAAHEQRLEEVFLAVFRQEAESDLFNALVIAAGLGWREAAVLRALAAFLRQARAPFSPRYLAETLQRNPAIARDIHAIFHTRFATPERAHAEAEAREGEVVSIRQRIETALGAVQSLDEDRMLRRLVGVVLAIVRTNVYLADASGLRPAVMAFKLASREIDRLPEPRPYREILVYSPRVEGVHLRFAPIARGGIRWSDRLQDYRTEILGLAKAQQVKNTVIVPSGAKGGFVLKQLARTATREETQAEGVACYRLFIEALLSLTDNIRDGKIVPPAGIARLDGDDPYLVVAADKGTATFSDYANAISVERGFWLGDAFASGGSAGYDHKRLGITARGAWECVKRHFREMDIDIQRQPFRVIGVGDMSGDVFGNGMLLSPEIRLVAAFDHRDIFIDPQPDAAISIAERKRLFDMPRSSWADYDRSKISAGGGVFSRGVKSIVLSEEMRALIGADVREMTPSDLIQALLRAEIDLLWFGGIGTFVRETGETDEQAGDRSNDALRVAASELRVKVIGEGANLGLTQRARIEAATRGIRLNTDFIDNSAGVNTSDKEVNIKIALQPALKTGRVSGEGRNRLLAEMAGDVAASVLENNHAQGLALSLAERASRKDLSSLMTLTRQLEERGLIDRKLEALPSGAELLARARDGKGMTRPELAVLMSWAKIALNADLLASTVPDGREAHVLGEYFPLALRSAYAADIEQHRLRREIVATTLTNVIVNAGGPDIIIRLGEAAGEPVPVLAEAFLAAREIFDIGRAWKSLDELDGRIAGSLQLHLYEQLRELSEREALGLIASRRGRTLDDMIAIYAPAARELLRDPASILSGRRLEAFDETYRELAGAGVPGDVAARHAGLALAQEVVSLADRAATSGAGVRETARVLFARDDFLKLGAIRERTAAMSSTDAFDQLAIERSVGIIERAAHLIGQRMMADAALRGVSVAEWARVHAPSLLEAGPVIEGALAEPGLSIARLGVIADSLRDLAQE